MTGRNRLALFAVLFTCAVSVAFSAPSLATPPDHSHDETDTHSHQNGAGHKGHGNGWGNGHHKGDAVGVPELDKSIAGSAAVLLGGGVFVILGRRKKR